MIYLITCLFFFLPLHAQAPKEPFPSDAQVLSQQGSLVSVKVVKGEPIKIFLVGRQEAELDFSNMQLDAQLDPSDFSLHVRRINSNKSASILKLKREKNYFVIENPDTKDKVFTLEVTTKVKGKKETFNFQIENKLH